MTPTIEAPSRLTGPEAKMTFSVRTADVLNGLAERHGIRRRCTPEQVHATLTRYLDADPVPRNALFERAMQALQVTREVPGDAEQDVSAG